MDMASGFLTIHSTSNHTLYIFSAQLISNLQAIKVREISASHFGCAVLLLSITLNSHYSISKAADFFNLIANRFTASWAARIVCWWRCKFVICLIVAALLRYIFSSQSALTLIHTEFFYKTKVFFVF